MIFPGWKAMRKNPEITRKFPEPGTRNFRVPGWNPEKFPSPGLEPGIFSEFRVETRKFFRVPGWNPEIFPGSGFRKFPGYFRVFPHCFPTRKNHDFSGFFRVGTRNPEFRWKPYPISNYNHRVYDQAERMACIRIL